MPVIKCNNKSDLRITDENKPDFRINYDHFYGNPLATITSVTEFKDVEGSGISFEAEFLERTIGLRNIPRIERIIVNKKKKATTVIWTDGDVTVVKRSKGDKDEPYFAVASALAIKCYGSNSKFKSIIDDKISYIGAKK